MARPVHRLLAGAIFAGLVSATGTAFAEVTVQNGLDRPLTIQLGYADQFGAVTWEEVTIEPCFVMAVAEAPNLRMIFPRYLDERLNPDTGTIDYEVHLLTQPGALTLFPADPRIMVDVFGNDACAGRVAPATPEGKPLPTTKPVPTN